MRMRHLLLTIYEIISRFALLLYVFIISFKWLFIRLLMYMGIINRPNYPYRDLTDNELHAIYLLMRSWGPGPTRSTMVNRNDFHRIYNGHPLLRFILDQSYYHLGLSLAVITYASQPEIITVYINVIVQAYQHIWYYHTSPFHVLQYNWDHITNFWTLVYTSFHGTLILLYNYIPYLRELNLIAPDENFFDYQWNVYVFSGHPINYNMIGYMIRDTFGDLPDFTPYVDYVIPADMHMRGLLGNIGPYRIMHDRCHGILLPRNFDDLNLLLNDPNFHIEWLIFEPHFPMDRDDVFNPYLYIPEWVHQIVHNINENPETGLNRDTMMLMGGMSLIILSFCILGIPYEGIDQYRW